MITHRRIGAICIIAACLAALIAALFMAGERLGLERAAATPGYALRLFDKSRVHTVEIELADWAGFLAAAPEEAYAPCAVTIDGERFENVAIRAKGNNSRRLIEKYGGVRYSLKLEMDHYTGATYYGLDKFSLDSSFQDNSYLKAYLAYDMMDAMGVPAPLCSYAFVTVNGADWGLFLAVEEPEEAFARRCFGADYGQLYKPDYKRLDEENADVALRYVGDDPALYDNIFRKAKFSPTPADKARLIAALKALSTGEGLEDAINVDGALRYFAVQAFVVNLDSYLGPTGHNYFLHEKDGRLTILPWDYNLAFATYSLGMPEPVDDATLYVNYPIDTPAAFEVMRNRPLYHNLMLHRAYFDQYHAYFDEFLRIYFENGRFEALLAQTAAMIAPYVQRDPTAFCSYEDHLLAVSTIRAFCLLRAQSVRGQLDGSIPSTIRGQAEQPGARVDASSIRLPDMGEVADLRRKAPIDGAGEGAGR